MAPEPVGGLELCSPGMRWSGGPPEAGSQAHGVTIALVFLPAPWRPLAVAAACSNQQIRQTCVRKSLICAFAIAFIISVMLIAANQVLRSGMK